MNGMYRYECCNRKSVLPHQWHLDWWKIKLVNGNAESYDFQQAEFRIWLQRILWVYPYQAEDFRTNTWERKIWKANDIYGHLNLNSSPYRVTDHSSSVYVLLNSWSSDWFFNRIPSERENELKEFVNALLLRHVNTEVVQDVEGLENTPLQDSFFMFEYST